MATRATNAAPQHTVQGGRPAARQRSFNPCASIVARGEERDVLVVTRFDAADAAPTAAEECTRDERGHFVGHYGPFQLRTAYQPIFRVGRRTAETYGFEGLIRVVAANGKRLPPDRFFPLIRGGDRFKVENLCRDLHLRNMARFTEVPAVLFANFDPSVFGERGRTRMEVARMERLAGEIGIPSDRIVCEITEKRALSPDALHHLVDCLRGAGYRIALDDYGADESDADRIESIAPDIVKFDAGWIKRLLETPAGYNLLASMVNQFHDRGIETLFEGLEERWQLELAEEMGVVYAQGFVLARPELAPANFAEFFVTDASDAFKMSDVPLPRSMRTIETGTRLFENEEQYGGDVLAQLRAVGGR